MDRIWPREDVGAAKQHEKSVQREPHFFEGDYVGPSMGLYLDPRC